MIKNKTLLSFSILKLKINCVKLNLNYFQTLYQKQLKILELYAQVKKVLDLKEVHSIE